MVADAGQPTERTPLAPKGGGRGADVEAPTRHGAASFEPKGTLDIMMDRKLVRMYKSGHRSYTTVLASYVQTIAAVALLSVLLVFYFYPTFDTVGLCQNQTKYNLGSFSALEKSNGPVLISCDTAYAVISNNFILWCACIAGFHFFVSRIFWGPNASARFRTVWNLSATWNIIFNSVLLMQCSSLNRERTGLSASPHGRALLLSEASAEATDGVSALALALGEVWGAVVEYRHRALAWGGAEGAGSALDGRRQLADSSPFPIAIDKALRTWWVWIYLIIFGALWAYCMLATFVQALILWQLQRSKGQPSSRLRQLLAYDIQPSKGLVDSDDVTAAAFKGVGAPAAAAAAAAVAAEAASVAEGSPDEGRGATAVAGAARVPRHSFTYRSALVQRGVALFEYEGDLDAEGRPHGFGRWGRLAAAWGESTRVLAAR